MWPAVFTVQDGYTFNVTMMSNSTISDFNFDESLKQISFNVTGPEGKAGYCNVTIPKNLLRDNPWTILLNDTDWTSSCTITKNATHTFIYIAYGHSTNTIQITGTWAVPEFSSTITLPLLMIVSLTALVFIKWGKEGFIVSFCIFCISMEYVTLKQLLNKQSKSQDIKHLHKISYYLKIFAREIFYWFFDYLFKS